MALAAVAPPPPVLPAALASRGLLQERRAPGAIVSARAAHPRGPPKPRTTLDEAERLGRLTEGRRAEGRERHPTAEAEAKLPALHQAVNGGDVETVRELLSQRADANAVKRQGLTPLMLAAIRGDEDAARLLLDARASPCKLSHASHTAADYAGIHGHLGLAETLRELQQAEDAADVSSVRCPCCSKRVKRRRPWHYVEDRVRSGEEANELVCQFFREPAVQAIQEPAWHHLNSLKSLRKEITETMAVVEVVARMGRSSLDGSSLHVVDLCCGKSLTTATLSQLMPTSAVTAIDVLEPVWLPHYSELAQNVCYLRLDILSPLFVESLETRIEAVGQPVCLLGVHCCGDLSFVALEAFRRIRLVQALVLVPCCLPSQRKASSPPELFRSKAAADQYTAWVDLLSQRAREADPSAVVEVWRDQRISSEKCGLIYATRGEPAAGSAPALSQPL